MGATWSILSKDLRIQLRSRSLLVLGFLAPLALTFVLDLVFGDIDDPEAPVTFEVGVVDRDGGDAARGFTAILSELGESGLLDLSTFDDEDAARAAVEDGDVSAAWVLPAGLSQAVGSGGEAVIVVIGDVDSPHTASFARALAERYAIGIGTATLAAQVAVETGVVPPAEAGTVAAEVASRPPLATVGALDTGTSLLDAATSTTAGIVLFFVFFIAGLPLMSLIQERTDGTLGRLLVAPIPAAAIVAGKFLAALILGVLSLGSLMFAATLLIGADFGPPAGALLLAVAAVVAAIGVMSVPGSLARTAEQAGNVQGIVAVVLAMLGGAFVPIPGSEIGLLGVLQRLTPHGWFLEGISALRDDGVVAALPHMGVLVAIGAITGAAGLSLSRRMLRR